MPKVSAEKRKVYYAKLKAAGIKLGKARTGKPSACKSYLTAADCSASVFGPHALKRGQPRCGWRAKAQKCASASALKRKGGVLLSQAERSAAIKKGQGRWRAHLGQYLAQAGWKKGGSIEQYRRIVSSAASTYQKAR